MLKIKTQCKKLLPNRQCSYPTTRRAVFAILGAMQHSLTSLSSKLLVTAQSLLIGYFVLTHPLRQTFTEQDIVAWTFVLAGFTLGAWAFFTLRPSFRITPEPRTDGSLITTGPYASIRHPMYTSLLLITFGLFLNFPILGHLLAFLVLFVVLTIKLEYEEHLLQEKYPDYTRYQTHTKRLIPFVY